MTDVLPPGPRRRRRRAFVPLHRVALPPGAPLPLRRALLGARLREALGPEIGPLLADWRVEGEVAVLVLADSSRLARGVSSLGPDLEEAVSRALGRGVTRVVVRPAPIDSSPGER